MRSGMLAVMFLAGAALARGAEVDDRQAAANAKKINLAVRTVLDGLQKKDLTKLQGQKLYGDQIEKLRTQWNGTPVLLRIVIEDVEWDARHWWGPQRGEAPAATFKLIESPEIGADKWELANPKYRGRFALPMTETEALKIKKGSLLVVCGEARIDHESSGLADDPGGSWITWWGCDQGLAIDKPTFRIEPPAKPAPPKTP